MERDDTLRTRVLSRLERGWSPEQVAGRLKLEAGRRVISHESIYRFIYGQLARTKDSRRIMGGATTFLVPSRSVAGEAAGGQSCLLHGYATPDCRASPERR